MGMHGRLCKSCSSNLSILFLSMGVDIYTSTSHNRRHSIKEKQFKSSAVQISMTSHSDSKYALLLVCTTSFPGSPSWLRAVVIYCLKIPCPESPSLVHRYYSCLCRKDAYGYESLIYIIIPLCAERWGFKLPYQMYCLAIFNHVAAISDTPRSDQVESIYDSALFPIFRRHVKHPSRVRIHHEAELDKINRRKARQLKLTWAHEQRRRKVGDDGRQKGCSRKGGIALIQLW